jgi:hypothetical protein
MTRYREQNNELTPSVPCVFIYDVGGGQVFTTSGVFHTWDTIKIKTSGLHYTADDDRITLLTNTSGLFIFEFECSFSSSANDTDLYVTTNIYKNAVLLAGSTSITGLTGGGQAALVRTCQSIHYIIYLEKDDYIQIKSTASGNTATSTANTSRLMINFLPMRGYDNDKAGRISFKGEIMR